MSESLAEQQRVVGSGGDGANLAGNFAGSDAPRTDAWIKGMAAIKGRLGHVYSEHCFSLDQDCTFTFWLWMKKLEVGEEKPKDWPVELSLLHVKEEAFRVGPHLLVGFPQAPGHIFCGLHQIGNNQMVRASKAPNPTRTPAPIL